MNKLSLIFMEPRSHGIGYYYSTPLDNCSHGNSHRSSVAHYQTAQDAKRTNERGIGQCY